MTAWGVGLLSIVLSAIVAIYFSAPEMIFGIALLSGAIYSTRHGTPNGLHGSEGSR